MIEQIANDTYRTTSRGAVITVEKYCGGWLVTTDNAAARAYNMGRAAFKSFDTLEQVEKHYKSLRGLVALTS